MRDFIRETLLPFNNTKNEEIKNLKRDLASEKDRISILESKIDNMKTLLDKKADVNETDRICKEGKSYSDNAVKNLNIDLVNELTKTNNALKQLKNDI